MSSETSTNASSPDGLRAWQFFVLAALACATAVTFLVRGQGLLVVIMLALLMGATALVGIASLRTVQPLLSPHEDRVAVVGSRTRAALDREKVLTLRAIKDLEFDRAMGKVSEDDFREMAGRLRSRASRLIRQLDAGAGYRAQIEQDLAKRLGTEPPSAPPARRVCAHCQTANEPDARFCKGCGTKL